MNRDFSAHLDALFACRACPNVIGQPVTGAVPGAKVMLIGQAPGPREVEARRPFAYTAGRRLFSWFEESLAMSEAEFRDRVYVGAVIRCFPGRDPKSGGDRVPDETEIANCAAHLDREIRILRPELVIAVGTLAAKQLVGIAELKHSVGRVHRASRAGHDFDVIVLPHPSGRSTWTNKKENAALLRKSLKLIREHPALKERARSSSRSARSPRPLRKSSTGG